MNNIDKLLYLTGVSASYFDHSGRHVEIDWSSRLATLQEIGYDATDDQVVADSVFELDAKPWLSWLSNTHFATIERNEAVEFRIAEADKEKVLHWMVIFEDGAEISGSAVASELEEVGEYNISGERYAAYRLPVPGLKLGYHQLLLWDDLGRKETAQLIVAPAKSYSDDKSEQRPWGFSLQIYTLRSDRNWGIGDFTDLAEFVGYAAQAGADLVALNPLHAPDLMGSIASPYSPSDRRFLNPLYIDPEIVPEYRTLSTAERKTVAQKISELRSLDLVDHDGVIAVKYPVLDQMFARFKQHDYKALSKRGKLFFRYLEQHGTLLSDFAGFEARNCQLELAGASDPLFHQYLQWLADEQLSACQATATAQGMRIGLMRDLAVGAAKRGAEVGCNLELFCQTATVGAPPDAFTDQGQNWNLPALNPVRLKAHDYRYFIDLIRTNMAHCGALRVDHILGLLRLWWCLPNMRSGAYVYYPVDSLLAIVRLESHRAKCRVIGEDMGVVPDELREKLHISGILGIRLFYFEKTPEGRYQAPQDQNDEALLMLTNHDVPTLAGWWQGNDIRINSEIHSTGESELEAQRSAREGEKKQLISWLRDSDRLPAAWQDSMQNNSLDLQLSAAVMTANASGRAPVFLIQPEDLLLEVDPVNIPGTDIEYPNWRRKLSVSTQQMFSNNHIVAVLAAIHQERS